MKPRYQRLLQDSLATSAAEVPDKPAVIATDGRISYAELDARSAALAAFLVEQGVRRGDRVAIFLDNSATVVIGIYAALRAGAAFVVINPQTKEDKLHYILADCGAVALVADGRSAAMLARLAPELPDLATVVLRGDARDEALDATALEAALAHGGVPADPGTIPLDLAALVYTSGSTGNPKGVMLSHQNMVFAQQSLCEYLRLQREDRILDVVPLAFDYGLYQALMSVHLGATLVLEPSFAFPAQVIQHVHDEQVTVFPGVPTVFATLLSLHRKQPLSMPSVRCITNTAAHLPDEYVPGLRAMCPDARIYKMYGLTECKRVSYLDPDEIDSKPSSVGKAIPGTETFVLDDHGERVPPGQVGVLHVRGPHVMMGYWNLPDETEHMLRPGPYPGERMLCTHDFFKVDDEGFLYFVGRSDDIIKSRGEKVSPIEVENAIHTIPGVREAAVVGVPDDWMGQAIRAFVVLHEGADLDERTFRRHCMDRLEGHMVPRDVVFMDELPKTGTGKVRKKDLVEQA
jgi:amino acid adenylation domain-containing protein